MTAPPGAASSAYLSAHCPMTAAEGCCQTRCCCCRCVAGAAQKVPESRLAVTAAWVHCPVCPSPGPAHHAAACAPTDHNHHQTATHKQHQHHRAGTEALTGCSAVMVDHTGRCSAAGCVDKPVVTCSKALALPSMPYKHTQECRAHVTAHPSNFCCQALSCAAKPYLALVQSS